MKAPRFAFGCLNHAVDPLADGVGNTVREPAVLALERRVDPDAPAIIFATLSMYSIRKSPPQINYTTSTTLGVEPEYLSDNPYVDCAYFPASGKLVCVNSDSGRQTAHISVPSGTVAVELEGYGMGEVCLRYGSTN
jgi:hypothetical protein